MLVAVLAVALIAGGVYIARASGSTGAAAHDRKTFIPPGMCDISPANIGNITVWNGFTSCDVKTGGPVPAFLRKLGYAAAMKAQESRWKRKGYTDIRCKAKADGYTCGAATKSGDTVVFSVEMGTDRRPVSPPALTR